MSHNIFQKLHSTTILQNNPQWAFSPSRHFRLLQNPILNCFSPGSLTQNAPFKYPAEYKRKKKTEKRGLIITVHSRRGKATKDILDSTASSLLEKSERINEGINIKALNFSALLFSKTRKVKISISAKAPKLLWLVVAKFAYQDYGVSQQLPLLSDFEN